MVVSNPAQLSPFTGKLCVSSLLCSPSLSLSFLSPPSLSLSLSLSLPTLTLSSPFCYLVEHLLLSLPPSTSCTTISYRPTYLLTSFLLLLLLLLSLHPFLIVFHHLPISSHSHSYSHSLPLSLYLSLSLFSPSLSLSLSLSLHFLTSTSFKPTYSPPPTHSPTRNPVLLLTNPHSFFVKLPTCSVR